MKWLAGLPMLELRVLSGVLMAFAVLGRYVVTGTEPPGAVLLFILGWAGVDVGQLVAQRVTSPEFVAARSRAQRPTLEA